MAAKTSVRVSLTNNAAKDDYFTGDSLDWLSENGSLEGQLDVLGNDPGSATLYAVSGDPLVSSNDQMIAQASDTFTVNFAGDEYTGHLTITDGKIGFDLSELYGHLDTLAEGEKVSVTFYYTAKMANGVLSTAKVTIDITGENDAPVAYAETVSVDEDSATSGQLDAVDVDHGAVLTFMLIDDAPAGFSLNPDGSYNFDASGPEYQHLAAGDSEQIVVSYKVTDEHGATGTNDITITVTGVNDLASIDAVGSPDTAVTEAGGTANGNPGDPDASGTLAVTDVDDGEDTFLPVAPAALVGTYGDFTFDDSTGEWTYALDQSKADGLFAGEAATDELVVTSLDGTATYTVTVDITGSNDAPVVEGTTAAATEDGGPVNGYYIAWDFDGDDYLGSLAFSILSQPSEGAVSDNGFASFKFDPGSDFQDLASGETRDVTFTYKATDSHGADSGVATVTVTVAGVNDAPEFSGDDAGSISEDADPDTISGVLVVNDADHDQSGTQANAAIAGDYGSLAIDANGNWTYTLNNAHPDVDALNDGEQLHDIITVHSIDGTAHNIDITINGHSDAGLVLSPAANVATPPTSDPDNNDNFTPVGGMTIATFNGSSNPAQNGAQSIYGTSGNDTVDAKGGADAIYGWAGNDNLTGGAGTDSIYGGSGNDTINGGQDTDNLFGGDGNDVINGDASDDNIYGGYGADVLTGSGGNDKFIYKSVFDVGSNVAHDSITDFNVAQDSIDLSNFHLANGSSFQFLGFSDTVSEANSLWQVGNHIFGDTDGDVNTAEFLLDVQAGAILTAANFIL